MIEIEPAQLLESTVAEHMIDADKVAHVQIGNNLEHALLVLTKQDIQPYLFWMLLITFMG